MTSEYKKAANELEGNAKVVAINCVSNAGICQGQRIHSYPTIKLYYNREEESAPMGDHSVETLVAMVKSATMPSDVVTLTPDSFKSLVLNSKEPWLVDFSAGPWCGPCTQLKSQLKKFATSVKGTMKVGIMNCDKLDFCATVGVEYYPFIQIYKAGDKNPEGKGEVLNPNEQGVNPANMSTSRLLPLLFSSPCFVCLYFRFVVAMFCLLRVVRFVFSDPSLQSSN